MIDPAIGALLSSALALLFASTALHKLLDLERLADVVRAYALVPSALARLSWLVPLVEFAVGAGLLFETTRASAALAGMLLLLAYAAGGLAIFFIMRALGELLTYRPVAGSFASYAEEFCGPFAGFVTGWSYWFMWVLTAMAELTAIGIYVGYWFPSVPQWLPALIALAVWLVGLLIWHLVDRSMARYAMEAISEDEDAAAAAGVNVTFEKLRITVISALMTALAGALYCQYQMFISPDTVSGIAVSLQMVFAAVMGGLYVALGPTVGAIMTILLAEGLRIGFGTKAVGWDNLIYGALLVLFIIFLPKGILGSLLERVRARPAKASVVKKPA